MVIKRLGKIAIGCFAILVILIILGLVFSGVIIKKLITGAIKEKTGVEVNVDDVNKGNLSYTDPKTGQTLNIGDNKVPDNFPKDFPIYPDSSVTSSLAGNDFWLSLTTKDNMQNVTSFYEENLVKNGWKVETTKGAGNTNWTVSKDMLSGYVAISRSASSGQADDEISIIIVLGEVKPQ